MAVTLILPNGAEVSSGPEPYCMTDAEAAQARRRGPGAAAAGVAVAQAAQHGQQLAQAATPETLAKVALGAGRATLAQMVTACGLEHAPAGRNAVLATLGAMPDPPAPLREGCDTAAALKPLQRDPLAFLAARGSLRGEQVRAGQEICRVYLAISAGITGRQVANYAEASARGPATEDWPVGLRTAYRDRYVPWTAWAGTQAASRKSRHTLHDLALLVAADGWGHAQVAAEWGMERRTVLDALQRSLYWYASHAGWVREASVAAA